MIFSQPVAIYENHLRNYIWYFERSTSDSRRVESAMKIISLFITWQASLEVNVSIFVGSFLVGISPYEPMETVTEAVYFFSFRKQPNSKFATKTTKIPWFLRYWQTRTHCCGHIVADTNVSPFARARNICCGHKFCVQKCFWFCSETFCVPKNVSQFARARKRHEQQCFRNTVSSFATAISKETNLKIEVLQLKLTTWTRMTNIHQASFDTFFLSWRSGNVWWRNWNRNRQKSGGAAIDDFINRKVQDGCWYWYSLLRYIKLWSNGAR